MESLQTETIRSSAFLSQPEVSLRRGTLSFDPSLHFQQREVWDCDAQFIVLVCGAGWGKTWLASRWLVKGALETGQMTQWIAPNYGVGQIGWEEMGKFITPQLGRPRLSERTWELVNGRVQIKSVDDPDAGRGRHIPRRVIEEASLMPEAVYNVIRPRVMSSKGNLMFLFTPKGKGHWTHNIYLKGLPPEHPDYVPSESRYPEWRTFHFPLTARLPHIPVKQLEDAKKDMFELAYRQEVLAEFISEGGAVFTEIRSHCGAELGEPEKGRRYVVGADIAQLQDFTVIYVEDDLRRIRARERFQHLPYPVIEERIAEMSFKFGRAPIVVDDTGLGKPVYDALMDNPRAGEIIGYTISAKSKHQLITGLISAFQDPKFLIPQEDRELIYELEIFEYMMTDLGNMRFSAPKHKHDDCVTALALADHGYRQRLATGGVELFWL